MNDPRVSRGPPGWLAALTPAAAAAVLLALLHRALGPSPFALDLLLLTCFRDIGSTGYAFLGVVTLACAFGVARLDKQLIVRVELYALAFGLLWTQYELGVVARKLDPRLVLGLLAGVGTLYASYLCLLAQLAIWVRERVWKS